MYSDFVGEKTRSSARVFLGLCFPDTEAAFPIIHMLEGRVWLQPPGTKCIIALDFCLEIS